MIQGAEERVQNVALSLRMISQRLGDRSTRYSTLKGIKRPHGALREMAQVGKVITVQIPAPTQQPDGTSHLCTPGTGAGDRQIPSVCRLLQLTISSLRTLCLSISGGQCLDWSPVITLESFCPFLSSLTVFQTLKLFYFFSIPNRTQSACLQHRLVRSPCLVELGHTTLSSMMILIGFHFPFFIVLIL